MTFALAVYRGRRSGPPYQSHTAPVYFCQATRELSLAGFGLIVFFGWSNGGTNRARASACDNWIEAARRAHWRIPAKGAP